MNRLQLFLAGLVAIGGGSWIGVRQVDSRGWDFFNTGKAILDAGAPFSKALKAKNPSGLDGFFSQDYKGTLLGLNKLGKLDDKDGIRRLAFVGGGDANGAAAGAAEWKQYLDAFESVEEAAIYVHELTDFTASSGPEAVLRYELIGTPKGSKQSGIDRAFIKAKFEKTDSGLKLASAQLVEGDRIISDTPQFTNVAAEAGVEFTNRYYPAFLNTPQKFGMIRYGPGGITATDFDNDGFYDLFIPDGEESKLMRNKRDGKFEDITAKAGLSGLDGVSVGVFADYDNDGFKDLFVSRTYKPNNLFHNNGDGTFTEVTKKAGLGEDCCTTVASWADYDNDGRLDLYLGRYLDPRDRIPSTFYARNGEPNQLYHNNGDGTFSNVTEKAGVGDLGLCLGNVWGDVDDDGFADLFVVNDFGRSTLYHNNRNGTFTDITKSAGAFAYGAGMNASMADYDNDGKLDLYTTAIRSEHAWFAEFPTVMRYMQNVWLQGVWKTDMPLYFEIFQQSGFGFVEVFKMMAHGNALLKNRGDLTFEDVRWKTGANPLGWFWGAYFGDYDNDGFLDIYAANGWAYNDKDTEIELEFLNNVVSHQDTYKTGLYFDPKFFGRRSWHGWERNRHLRSQGDGNFIEVGRGAGTDLINNSRGVAVADFWNRGRLDIAVSGSTDKHALLKNQVPNERRWLEVELVGTKSNRDAVGARVIAKAGGKMLTRELTAGDGYGSQNTLRQHFGLGDATQVDELVVKWPRSGITQKFTNVAANRFIAITEGTDVIVEKKYGTAAK